MLILWKSSTLGSVEWKLYFNHVTYISHHDLQNILLFCIIIFFRRWTGSKRSALTNFSARRFIRRSEALGILEEIVCGGEKCHDGVVHEQQGIRAVHTFHHFFVCFSVVLGLQVGLRGLSFVFYACSRRQVEKYLSVVNLTVPHLDLILFG